MKCLHYAKICVKIESQTVDSAVQGFPCTAVVCADRAKMSVVASNRARCLNVPRHIPFCKGEGCMPVGIIINALSVAIGGVVGALFGHKLPTRINSELTKIFGVCSMGMGVSSIGLMKNMPAVIFAVIIGTAFGLAVNLGGIINHGAACMEKPVGKIFPNKNASMSREEYMTMLVTIIVLFCASGTGIYGSLDSGMSGDHTILISKSILDFFTAMIFGGTL